MHQAAMDFSALAPGAQALYRVATPSGASATFAITPIVAVPRYAVYGDFGLVNDESMDDIIQKAHAGAFDAVLHVGDWAYDFEDLFSVTGNAFMNLAQGYQAIKPVAVAEGSEWAAARARGARRARPHARAPSPPRPRGVHALLARPRLCGRERARVQLYPVQGALPLCLAQLEHGQQPLLLLQ